MDSLINLGNSHVQYNFMGGVLPIISNAAFTDLSLGSISIKHINIAFCTIIDGLLLHSIPNELGMFWAGFELSKTTGSITIDDDIQNTIFTDQETKVTLIVAIEKARIQKIESTDQISYVITRHVNHYTIARLHKIVLESSAKWMPLYNNTLVSTIDQESLFTVMPAVSPRELHFFRVLLPNQREDVAMVKAQILKFLQIYDFKTRKMIIRRTKERFMKHQCTFYDIDDADLWGNTSVPCANLTDLDFDMEFDPSALLAQPDITVEINEHSEIGSVCSDSTTLMEETAPEEGTAPKEETAPISDDLQSLHSNNDTEQSTDEHPEDDASKPCSGCLTVHLAHTCNTADIQPGNSGNSQQLGNSNCVELSETVNNSPTTDAEAIDNEGMQCDSNPVQCYFVNPLFTVEDNCISNSKIRSISSLPDCLHFKSTPLLHSRKIRQKAMGVFANIKIKCFTRFGPVVGDTAILDSLQNIGEADLDYIWFTNTLLEPDDDNDSASQHQLFNTFDEISSNWCRYLQCSAKEDECNLIAVQQNQLIYLTTNKDIDCGEQLIYFVPYLKQITDLCKPQTIANSTEDHQAVNKDKHCFLDADDKPGEIDEFGRDKDTSYSSQCMWCKNKPLPFLSETRFRKHMLLYHCDRLKEILNDEVLYIDQGDEHCEVDDTCSTDVNEESSVERDASVDTVSDEILDPVTGCLVKFDLVDDECVSENIEELPTESKVYESLLTKRFVTLGTTQHQTAVNLLPKPRKQSKSKVPAGFPKVPGPQVCPICSKVCKSYHSLNLHVKSVHPPESSYQQCQQCNKKFKSIALLRLHKAQVHTTVHVTCSLCGASFGRKHSLLRHMKIHTREKSCICHYCGKAFRDPGHLKIHMKIHGIAPYHCVIPHCDSEFDHYTALKNHYMDQHNLTEEQIPKTNSKQKVEYQFSNMSAKNLKKFKDFGDKMAAGSPQSVGGELYIDQG